MRIFHGFILPVHILKNSFNDIFPGRQHFSTSTTLAAFVHSLYTEGNKGTLSYAHRGFQRINIACRIIGMKQQRGVVNDMKAFCVCVVDRALLMSCVEEELEIEVQK